jgi:hypothetical protein
VDAAGNLYIADTFNAVRKVSPTGAISTIAGSYQAAGYSGDGGPATKAALFSPAGLAVDGTGNLYCRSWQQSGSQSLARRDDNYSGGRWFADLRQRRWRPSYKR